jgi:hypothetical protein
VIVGGALVKPGPELFDAPKGEGAITVIDLADLTNSYEIPLPASVDAAKPLEPLAAATAIRRLKTGTMVVFGGADSAGKARNDLWEHDFATGKWKLLAPVTPPPPKRFGHAAAYDESLDRMIVLGGLSGSGTALGDIWTYDFGPGTWEQVQVSLQAADPPDLLAAAYPAMGYDSQDAKLVVLSQGPWDGTRYPARLWELDLDEPGSKTPLVHDTDVSLPEAAFSAAAFLDPKSRSFYVFGGGDGLRLTRSSLAVLPRSCE